MKRLWFFFAVNGMSFAVLTVLYASLSLLEITGPFSSILALQFYLATAAIALLMVGIQYFFERIDQQDSMLRKAADILSIVLVVYLAGGAGFGWFSLARFDISLVVLAMILVIYLLVYLFISLRTILDARKINASIQQRKRAQKGTPHDECN